MTEEDVDSPTCYRHPDRETYVQCTRCERYICPDCMNDAAVGFQCPECVKEGNKSVRQARTVVGGRAVQGGLSVVNVLIAVNVVMFLIQQTSSELVQRYAQVGIAPGTDGGLAGVATGEYYRLLTSAFLHADLFHIGFNMYALFVVGTLLEEQLGRVRFIALYLISALGGSVLSYSFASFAQFSLGASGAIFGLFGAYFVIARRLRRDTSQIGMLIVINLVIGQVIPKIDNRAHVGGLVVGAALAYVWAHLPRTSARTALQAVAAVVAVALIMAAAVVRTNELDRKCLQSFGPECLTASSAALTSATGASSR